MPRRIALLITNRGYQARPLCDLPLPAVDVPALAQLLRQPTVGNFDRVTVLADLAAADLRHHIQEFFHWKRPYDLLLLYFHGLILLDDAGNLFLAGRDTDAGCLTETAVSLPFLTSWMDRSFARRQIIILESGHLQLAGGAPPAAQMPLYPALAGRRTWRMFLLADDAVHAMWDGQQWQRRSLPVPLSPRLRHGLATGAANGNADSQIDMQELHAYIQQAVPTARLWTYDESAAFVIARDVRTFTQRAPIKWDLLLGGILAPLATVVIGGVSDLFTSTVLAALLVALYAFLYQLLE